MAAPFAHALLLAIVGGSLLLMLARPRGVPEVYWVGGGALALLALRLLPVALAVKAVARGADVYLFLTGMMLLSELAREHGVFDWLSMLAVERARGSAARLFTLIYGVGTLVTVFLSNDAAAVVLTPAVLSVVRKARVAPLPYLFACALIANAASFVLPISNPANLVVFHQGMPPLGRWLLLFGIPSVLSVAATYAVLRFVFRRELQSSPEQAFAGSAQPARLGADGRVVLLGLALVAAVLLAASALGRQLGLPTCLAAAATAGIVSWRARANPFRLLRRISWSTLALVAALFILVQAVESIGALRYTGAALRWAQSLGAASGALLTGFAVGVANNLVNNLPLGLLAGSTLAAAHPHGLLTNAVLIGVDLGPNLSITGSLATILWLLALRKEQVAVSFWSFLKVGAAAMPAALLLALAAAIPFAH